jgi:hypothetical protein
VQTLLASASQLSNDEMAGEAASGLEAGSPVPDTLTAPPKVRLWDELRPPVVPLLQNQSATNLNT